MTQTDTTESNHPKDSNSESTTNDHYIPEITIDGVKIHDTQLHWNILQHTEEVAKDRSSINQNVRTFVSNIIGNIFGANEVIQEIADTQYLAQLFHELDKDESGSIDQHELFEGFIERGAGDKFTQSEILSIVSFMDKNGDDEIDFDEFTQMFGRLSVKSMQDLIEKSYVYILFNEIDEDCSGKIGFDEMKSFFIANQIKITDSDIIRLMKQVDEDDDEEMDFYEFYGIFSQIKSFDDLVTESRLRVIFNSIDTDASGELEFDEIKQLFISERIDLSDAELHAMMDNIDENDDGVIDFDEFKEAFSFITDLNDLVSHWHNLNSIDIGSDLSVGSGLSKCSFLPIIAGGLGGIMSRTATAPLERFKILAQTGKFAKISEMFKAVVERQGFWRGLWKGNFYGCLRIFPFAGCVTFTYSLFLKHVIPKAYRDRIDNPSDPMTHIWRFSAGLTAGCIATTITYPLDLMKANEATDMTHTKRTAIINKGTFARRLRSSLKISTIKGNFVREMQENNITSFRDAFRGLLPTIFAVPFFIGIQNMSYDFFRIYCTSQEYLNMSPSIELFAACGCAAGITAQSIVYPIDVIRRRIQTDTMWKDPKANMLFAPKVGQSRRWINGVINMVRVQGLRPLFAGLTPTYCKVMPSVAISVTTRDILLGRLNND